MLKLKYRKKLHTHIWSWCAKHQRLIQGSHVTFDQFGLWTSILSSLAVTKEYYVILTQWCCNLPCIHDKAFQGCSCISCCTYTVSVLNLKVIITSQILNLILHSKAVRISIKSHHQFPRNKSKKAIAFIEVVLCFF